MFKRTDEAEWSRFSKALSNKERDASEHEEDAPEEDGAPQETAVPTPASSVSPSTPRSPQDINVTVSRPSRTATPAPVSVQEHESVIADQTFIDGTLRAEESIRIRGAIQGEVESKRHVYIEEQAKVTAKVTGDSVTVAGQVNGQIYCAGRVEIQPSGRVIGEITAGTLIMQEGAFFEGNLKMAARGEESRVEVTSGVSH